MEQRWPVGEEKNLGKNRASKWHVTDGEGQRPKLTRALPAEELAAERGDQRRAGLPAGPAAPKGCFSDSNQTHTWSNFIDGIIKTEFIGHRQGALPSPGSALL